MTRLTLAFLAMVAAAGVTGCGGSSGNVNPDGGGGLPDGFISTTCTSVSDCSPTMCQTAKCNPVTKQCEYKDKTCTNDSECTVGVCDPGTGECGQQPGPDGTMCSTTGNSPEAGTCNSGTCTPVPSCYDSNSFTSVSCDSSQYSVETDDNTPGSFGKGKAVVGSYACAPNEAGPEIGYRISRDFDNPEEDVTVSLRLVDAAGKAIADQTVVDLDLIILEDSCIQAATCMNPAATTGFVGVTAGTSKESVTFHAAAGKTYYAVIDGKDMNQVHKFAVEVEACGRCQPTATTRVDCNTSMPITTNTSAGAAKLTDYMCGADGAKTTVPAVGNEVPFLLKTTDSAPRKVTATITGAADGVKLLNMPQNYYGHCLPADCDQVATAAGGTASISFSADPGTSFNGDPFQRYFIIVDAPTTTDSAFGLAVSCAPYCLQADNYLSCGGNAADEVKKITSTTVGSPTKVTAWGPGAGCDGLTGLAGPEQGVLFKPDVATAKTYQVELTSKTAGVTLSMTVLNAGTDAAPSCDPTLACTSNTVVTSAGVYSGSRTTTALPAALQFVAQPNHNYYIAVDSAAGTGGAYDMRVTGITTGAGCP